MKEEKGATWKETSVLMTSPGLEAGGASKRPDMADGGGGWAGDGGAGREGGERRKEKLEEARGHGKGEVKGRMGSQVKGHGADRWRS